MNAPVTPVDAPALVRFELVQIARRLSGARCLVRAIRATASDSDPGLWCDIGEDFRSRRGGSNWPAKYAADAADAMLGGDTARAVEGLAASCDLSTEAWVAETREEMLRAR